MIYEALKIAQTAHKGQTRKDNGAPYLTHVTRVAGLVMSHPKCTKEMIVAALLHDVLEDQPDKVSPEVIQAQFGSFVLNLVQELTSTSKQLKKPRAERKKIDHERLKRVSEEAKIIKLYDRIDNLSEMLRDIDTLPLDRIKFCSLYACESDELLIAIGDVDLGLTDQLQSIIDKLRKKASVLVNERNKTEKQRRTNGKTRK